MTQFIEQLRNQAKWYAQPGHNARDLMGSHLLEKAANEIECLRAKVEAAEKSDAESIAMYRKARDERDALRAMLRAALDVLEEVKGNINPERGYADELEADVERAIATITIPGAKTMLPELDEVTVVLDRLDDYIARIEGNDRGACHPINLIRRYLLDAAEVGGNK